MELVVSPLRQLGRDESPLVEEDAYVETAATRKNAETTCLEFVEEYEAVKANEADSNRSKRALAGTGIRKREHASASRIPVPPGRGYGGSDRHVAVGAAAPDMMLLVAWTMTSAAIGGVISPMFNIMW